MTDSFEMKQVTVHEWIINSNDLFKKQVYSGMKHHNVALGNKKYFAPALFGAVFTRETEKTDNISLKCNSVHIKVFVV